MLEYKNNWKNTWHVTNMQAGKQIFKRIIAMQNLHDFDMGTVQWIIYFQ